MGNQMFQYAFARALAERNNDKVVLDAAPLLDRTPRPNFIFRGYDLDLFTIDAELTLFSRATLRFPVPVLWAGLSVVVTLFKSLFGIQTFIRETDKFTPSSIEFLPRHGNFYLDGAWQNEKYFEAIAPVLRREFTLREPLSARAQELEAEIRANVSIGINVRRGDFITLQRSIEQHGFVGLEYYENGMKEIMARLAGGRGGGSEKSGAEKIHVYVSSDEIDWCRENLRFPAYPDLSVTYVGREYAGKKFSEYFYLLSACRHFIIPNSSFAWWAAWLGDAADKIVIAPRQWFANGADDRGVVPTDWVRI
jgi:Glycosyl transferase family 11